MGPCIIMLQHEVMVVDEWHNNGPQDLFTVSLFIQNAINKMHLCSLSITYTCPYHNPTTTMGHSIHKVDISKPTQRHTRCLPSALYSENQDSSMKRTPLQSGRCHRMCSLAQIRDLICPIKTGFVLLLILTSVFVFTCFYDFSLKPVKHPQTWFNLVNQTQSYNVTTEIKKFVWDLSGTDKQIIQTVHHVAHPSNYHFILDEPDKCKQNPFLVLMVPVAPYQVDARNAIRSTWGNESSVQGKTLLTLFLVGLTRGSEVQQQLEEESRQHRDLVQSNFVDSYFNLTIKTMVIMDWLATRCPQANYSMKVDSDMYINLENLMNLLLAPNTPRKNYMTGFLMWNQKVIRNKTSKYYVSEELYPEPKYPLYVLGVAYVFSNDLPPKIVEVSKHMQPFNIEDAYVGTCLKRLGLKPSRAPDPSQFRTYKKDSKHHDLSKVITTIARSPKQIIEFWQNVKRQNITDKPA
ncbi:beta-1,3-galactosyltransferase 1-like [Garra rufa]|uniref:beta-1,3-galactosyltransferase 1-like n=1 Tax=Garra rufa TaxID=137080 RepID=UPI003CCE5F3E